MVGAGHAGLAVSRVLTEHSIDHVVLERAEVANSWRCERWDSLRLLTPNWQSRLPGYPYQGDDAAGYMSMPQIAAHISGFAAASRAPVRTHTEVTALRRLDAGYHVLTRHGEMHAHTVVLASGAANLPHVPEICSALPAQIRSLTPFDYRNPTQLDEGGVLVVGASATGVQLADEIQRSGRPVTLAVGEHVRLPRTYRGQDVLWWMENAGIWRQRFDEIDDLQRARRLPSPQLIGSRERAMLDINALRSSGVEIVGRLAAIREGCALFSGGLANLFALADLKLQRLLENFDAWAAADHSLPVSAAVERFEPSRAPAAPRLSLDLRTGNIRTVLWATGFRPDYRWLNVPVLNRKGEMRHEGGIVTEAPGMYVIGLPVLRRRRSTFILGAEDDARDLVSHLVGFVGWR